MKILSLQKKKKYSESISGTNISHRLPYIPSLRERHLMDFRIENVISFCFTHNSLEIALVFFLRLLSS